MAVVFDLGGVVFQWQPLALLQQILPARAPDALVAKKWADQIFESFNPLSDWAQFDLGLIEPDALAAKISKRVGISEAEMHLLIDSIPSHMVPKPGTVEIISDLKAAGHALYYLSNMPAGYANFLESSHSFFQHFSDGIFSARVQQMKPQLPIFQSANQRFGVSGKNTVFIDDVQHNIDAANAHGWTGVRFDAPEQVRRDLVSLGLLN
jgi:2-haloacid dehalogenase/putative hydrolase of the HAD superfamily